MVALSTVMDNWVAVNNVPARIVVLVKDLIAYRRGSLRMAHTDVHKKVKKISGYMKACYHNKGIDMLQLPRILNSKYVRDTVHALLSHRTPPVVSYSYTKTISGKILNQKRVIESLDFNVGIEDTHCECSTCIVMNLQGM